jgi:hypothetical protein
MKWKHMLEAIVLGIATLAAFLLFVWTVTP